MPTALNAPPSVLDGAKVLAYIVVNADIKPTGAVTLIVGGKNISPVPRFAICQNDDETDVSLLHCNDAWVVLGAGYYQTIQQAQDSVSLQYPGSFQGWRHVA